MPAIGVTSRSGGEPVGVVLNPQVVPHEVGMRDDFGVETLLGEESLEVSEVARGPEEDEHSPITVRWRRAERKKAVMAR